VPDASPPQRHQPNGAFGAVMPSRFAPAPARPPVRHTGWHPAAIGLAFVVMFTMVGLWITNPVRFQVASGLFVVPILFLLTLFLCARARRIGADFDIAGLMLAGLGLRVFALFYRYRFLQDAGIFHQTGSVLAESFRSLHFDVDVGAPMPGTGGMRYVTGIVEVITNNNEYATFAVFTWLAFVGCYLFYEAFVTAMPDGNRRRYALLIFLWPTLLYWPSSISKDGWMLFSIGLASVGVARVLARMRGGYVYFLVGALLGSVVRPHIPVMALVSLGLALLLARRPARHAGRATTSGVAKVAGFVVLIGIGALLATQLGDFLNARDLTVDSAITQNTDRTAQGGSAFQPANPQNPIGYAKAAVTILFRPFPFEAHGIEQLLTAVEALALAGLCIVSWRRLASVPFRLRGDPYVAYALSMVLMFIFVLGTIGNFGILARQRSQVVPFLFVLLCVNLPARTETAARVGDARDLRA
jgi:hypothetical protein